MKKIYAMSFAALLASSAFAQKPEIKRTRTFNDESVTYSLQPENAANMSVNQRSTALNETFASVPPLGWSAKDFLLSNSTQAAKAPGANGTYAYYEASNREPGAIGTLNTPILQPDANNNKLSYKVNLYVINAAWKDAGAKMFIDFSEDYGVTWKLDTLNNILASLTNYNAQTTGWIAKEVDLSAYIGKKVVVRFRGVADYGMANIGIDDVTGPNIFTLTNDISGKRLAASVNGVGFSQYTPISQLDSIYFSAQVVNNGSSAQTNVTLKTNINKDVDFATGYKNPIASLASGKTDTLWVSAKPKRINDTTETAYGAKIWLEQTEVDEVPTNNILDSITFFGTSSAYLRTSNGTGPFTSYSFGPNAPAKTGFEYGVKYLITKDTRVDSIFTWLYYSSGEGKVVGKLYTITPDSAGKAVYTLVANTDTLKPAKGTNMKFTNMPFKTPYECKANTMLIAAIQLNGDMGTTNKDTLTMVVDGQFPSNPLQTAIGFINGGGNFGWYSLPVVPLVGLELKTPAPFGVGVKENTISKANIFPNPASSQITVNFNTANAASIELINIVGQVIENRNVASGAVSATFDMANLNSGIYFVRIKSDNGQSTYKVVKN